jgi:hypothetical protein
MREHTPRSGFSFILILAILTAAAFLAFGDILDKFPRR